MRTALRRLAGALARRPRAQVAALAAPGTLWLAAFVLLPLAVMLAYSVMPRGAYGGVTPGFTLEHYRRFLDPLYLAVLGRTLWLSLACTVLCLALGFPLAWVIARSGRWKHVLLFLVVLPLWTSFLVRTYGLMFLLRDSGLVNHLLQRAGLIDVPLTLLYTPGAVLAGLVYGHLPLMVMPIYAALERLDPALLEAAEVLGARPFSRLRRVILPLSMPGVAAGVMLVFIPSLGAFLTPDLLGGAKQVMIGNLVQNQFGPARNWPFGAAASFIVMTVVLAAMLVMLRRRGREDPA